jgi:hypothetical protein
MLDVSNVQQVMSGWLLTLSLGLKRKQTQVDAVHFLALNKEIVYQGSGFETI